VLKLQIVPLHMFYNKHAQCIMGVEVWVLKLLVKGKATTPFSLLSCGTDLTINKTVMYRQPSLNFGSSHRATVTDLEVST